MSMLAEPNTESPANVDAAKMWREDRSNNQFYKLGRSFSCVETFHWKVIFRCGESYIYAEASEAQAHLARLIQGSHDSKHGSITFTP